MRKLIAGLILAAAVLLFPNPGKADGVTATATYSDSTKHTAFSAPGRTISFSFNLPSSIPSLEDPTVPVDVSFKGKSFEETADIMLFSGAEGGLFNLEFEYKNHSYLFEFFGGQLFDSSDNLIAGTYPLGTFDGVDSLLYKDNGDNPSGIFTSGKVVVSKATAVPEPASLLLLGMGLFGFFPLAKRKFLKA